ncbi:hypothetical protein BT96DRAFT_926614 [Gymnopus androsaceus JB14]|uniref:Uncharacterized protein n=1 Tax=Gymnopus androsaceus JB14 TaxID=1447944 RepID=A0A6A4GW86_9AGAR|nr:hypothetical protein BT96DRAFT_926614 [Gymnopus androsaceus JB14]
MTRHCLPPEGKQNSTEGPDESFSVENPHLGAQKHPRSEHDEELDEDLEAEETRVPPEFRKVKGKFGLLEKFAKDAPLDIFFHGNLLQLALSSRNLRNVLLHKSSESIWHTARSNVGLLPPPDDLSKPRYAHLVFFIAYCHKPRPHSHCSRRVFWVLRMRCCKTCASKLLTTLDKAKKSLKIDDLVANVIPCEELPGGKFLKLLQDLHYNDYYAVQSSTAVIYQAEFNALETNEERVAWLESMKNVKETQLQHATHYHQWEHLMVLSAAVVSQWTAAGRVF